MVDRHLLDQMERVLSKLSAPVAIIDKDISVHTLSTPDVPLDLTDGVIQRVGELFCLPVKLPAVILCCNTKEPGASDILTMAGALIEQLCSSEKHTESSFDVYRHILRGDIVGTDLDAMSHEYQLPQQMKRSVLVFHVVQTERERAYDLLKEIAPLLDKDVLIDMDRHTAALIKNMTEVEDSEELLQFAQALQETLMSETARQMTVGIGSTISDLSELGRSFREARRAIEVGTMFQHNDSIFLYDKLVLERLLMEVSPEVCAMYHHMLFNPKTARLFNEEMLYTIDMFLKKDLNLSDTARQLFIHRNTLVYRLDKIQKQTGLDLRSFDDAVTFKILMELKHCADEHA